MTVELVSYSAYLPTYRLAPEDIGGRAGGADRVVASFDEDSTTMAVEAASEALRAGEVPSAVYFASSSHAYADKTNAVAVHAALGLPSDVFCADFGGTGKSSMAAIRCAAASGGLAVMSDVRTGRPGSADERSGGDGAAAFVFADGAEGTGIAAVLSTASSTLEFLDRWRDPTSIGGSQWEERYGQEQYTPLIAEVQRRALAAAQVATPDHVVLTSPNSGIRKRLTALASGAVSTVTSAAGFSGTADVGIALAETLDTAAPGDTVLVLSAVDGCDALVLRVLPGIVDHRARRPVAEQRRSGHPVPYLTYLSWRGLVDREPPRRPEPDRPAAPPSGRATAWKFAFVGSCCAHCGFVHLPPARVCRECGAVDAMHPESRRNARGTVATSTIDRLAFSPSPPVVEAVVDFDGGGRCTLEVADGAASSVIVGTRVELTFRRLFTAGGVHNYFWKARIVPEASPSGDESK